MYGADKMYLSFLGRVALLFLVRVVRVDIDFSRAAKSNSNYNGFYKLAVSQNLNKGMLRDADELGSSFHYWEPHQSSHRPLLPSLKYHPLSHPQNFALACSLHPSRPLPLTVTKQCPLRILHYRFPPLPTREECE